MEVRKILLSIFLSACQIIFAFTIFAQPALKNESRKKGFGKSLKKYEKKSESALKNSSADEDSIRVETNLVVSDVLVANEKGNAIIGLKQSDFIVAENGEPQEIELFTFGENARIPRSIVLIMDYSGSVIPYLNTFQAAKNLVDKLGEQDRMAIVTDDVELLVDFTKDKTVLKKALDKLKEKCEQKRNGKSWQYSALLTTLNEMFDAEDIRPIIIFQTDGDEIPAIKRDAYFVNYERLFAKTCARFPKYCKKDFSYTDVLQAVEKSRATIYSIIPGLRFAGVSEEEKLKRAEQYERDFIRTMFPKEVNESWAIEAPKKYAQTTALAQTEIQEALIETAKLSGGYAEFLENPEDAESIYNGIFKVIENRYVIGYYPTNEYRDGKRRTVKIEVKGHPEYTVMGRKSYFAPQENK